MIFGIARAAFPPVIRFDKPYEAVRRLREDAQGRAEIVKLLHALLDHSKPLPANAIATDELLAAAAAPPTEIIHLPAPSENDGIGTVVPV